MSDEKRYSAKEAAIAVLKKAEEMLKNSELAKAAPYNLGHREAKGIHHQAGPTHSGEGADTRVGQSRAGANIRSQGKLGVEHAKTAHKQVLSEMRAMPKPNLTKAQPPGEIHPKEPQAGESEQPGDRIKTQVAPDKNPKEQAEGNNELAGTTPTQVGQDGKNKPGFSEMQSEIQLKGHLKLAKFIGYAQAKRKTPAGAI